MNAIIGDQSTLQNLRHAVTKSTDPLKSQSHGVQIDNNVVMATNQTPA